MIALHDVTVAYERHPAVHHLTGGFAPGSLTAVVGPNGAGKSTLLKALAGVLRPVGGRIERGAPGTPLERRRIAYLPQLPELDRRFPISVLDTVLTGAWPRTGWYRAIDAGARAAAADALTAVGLEGFRERPIGTLSVGQFQRVLFARLMVQDAALILLDEPFNALDARTVRDLVALIERWHGERRTVIAVLHDLDQVRRHFPDALLLARECIAWGPTAGVLTEANLHRARHMSESWDPQAEYCAPAHPH
jgi:zinc/manganese transport system ATP-binding protein